jgi:DNA-binding transcriptional LysR family regulator
MVREDVNDLIAFLAVARERSFTRAAAQLGVSQSALSQTVKGLEERLGLRLLARTTRSVAPTDAGERLLKSIGPHLDGIEAGLATLTELRETPAGTVRITADEYAVRFVLWPAMRRVLSDYPDIVVELVVDYGLTDIVAERYDAGVRLGGIIAKDMIAVPIGPDMRMATVAAPSYFATRPPPRTPQDLTDHTCINLRLPTYGGLYAWEFERNGRELRVRVEGQLVFNSVPMMVEAALEGYGIAYITEAEAMPYLTSGQLVRVLDDWCEPFSGYHLYYPSRRQQSPAFAVVVDALRYRSAPAVE